MRNLSIAIVSGLFAAALGATPAMAKDGAHGEALLVDAAALHQIDFGMALDRQITAAAPGVTGAQDFRLAAAARLTGARLALVAGAPVPLGAAPAPLGNGLADRVPRLGKFDLTFASDMPASGIDPMFNAEVVVALTRRF